VALSLSQAKARIDAILATYATLSASPTSLLTGTMTSGKVYEAWVLTVVLEKLRTVEAYTVTLVGGTKVTLKSSPGPVNRSYPHFRLRRVGSSDREVWTDVEFTTLSHSRRPHGPAPGSGDYHELDIVVVDAGVNGRPSHDEIRMGVECKNTGFEKQMMRAALGIRRELSLLSNLTPTIFKTWPRTTVPADPPSVYVVYSTDPRVTQYNAAGQVFGVDFICEPM
jgi:hypothetical protein